MSPERHSKPGGSHRAQSLGTLLLLVPGALLLCVSILAFSIHLKNNAYLRDATAFIFDAPGDDESKAIALAHFVAVEGRQPVEESSSSYLARLEHQLPFELSPVTVLRHGFAFANARRFGPCGQLSRTVRAVGWLRGIPSHKVLLGPPDKEHAMVALKVDGAYRLFDPTYDFYWTNRQGRVATIEEVRSDPEIFAQVFRKVPNYPYRLDDATYFRWRRLGRAGEWIRSTLASVMGAEWVANIDTPMLYERPWWGYAWISLTGALFFFALAAWRFLATRPRPVLEPALMTGARMTAFGAAGLRD